LHPSVSTLWGGPKVSKSSKWPKKGVSARGSNFGPKIDQKPKISHKTAKIWVFENHRFWGVRFGPIPGGPKRPIWHFWGQNGHPKWTLRAYPISSLILVAAQGLVQWHSHPGDPTHSAPDSGAKKGSKKGVKKGSLGSGPGPFLRIIY